MSQNEEAAKPMLDFEPENLFSTPFWSRVVVDHELINRQLLELLPLLEENTPAAKRSNVGGLTIIQPCAVMEYALRY